MNKKIKRNTTFVKTRARLKQAEPPSETPTLRRKPERLFSESRDIREDRAIRQLKTARAATQKKVTRKTKVT